MIKALEILVKLVEDQESITSEEVEAVAKTLQLMDLLMEDSNED